MKSHEELEAKVTALLLGELSPDEAAAVRGAIGKDTQLAQLHERLKQTIGLVREAAVSPVYETPVGAEAPKLPAERRGQLLAAFKTVRPRELRKARAGRMVWREWVAVAAMVVGLHVVGALLVGHYFRSGYEGKSLARRVVSLARNETEATDARMAMKPSGGARRAFQMDAPPAAVGGSYSAEVRNPEESTLLHQVPANSVSSPSVKSKEMASAFVVADPRKALDQMADLASPSLPSREVRADALTPQAPPPAASPTPVTVESRSVPDRAARGSSIVLPSVEDTVSATTEGKVELQVAQSRFGERQSGPADDFRQAELFERSSADQRDSLGRGRPGRGGGRAPAAAGIAPTDPQTRWDFSGAEYAGVGGAGSISAPTPSAIPLPSLRSPAPQSVLTPAPNQGGVRLKDADGDFARPVVVTNSVVVGAKFADIESRMDDSFFVSGLGGFAGRNGQVTDGRNQSQFGVAPIDSLGTVAGAAPSLSDGANVNRFYSYSGVANSGSAEEQKRRVGDDAATRELKLADVSKDKKSGVVAGDIALAFDVQAGRPLSSLQAEVGQKSAESLPLPKAEKGDALAKGRVDIALPQVERGEALEKLQVASGPVAAGEPAAVANRPSPASGNVVLAADDSARRSLERQLGETESLKRLSDMQVLAEHDQPVGAVDLEAKLIKELAKVEKPIELGRELLEQRKKELGADSANVNRPALAQSAPIPQPEVTTADSAFSTFSLNVSDVSFKLAAASLEKGRMPDPATVRSEEFINAFDYRDPEPAGRAPIAFAWERARYPFAHDRDLVRLSVKTAASGRQPGRPLNLVLLLDNSGSMERSDRLRIRQECLRVLVGQLRPEDLVSVVAFARTARLWVDGLSGAQAGELPQRVGSLTPEGGTNLEDAMNLAYQTALRHFLPNGVNRVVLLTDGAANLGDVQPESLKKKVEGNRRQGIALDCFGLGWDGYNDDLLEVLSRNGDGRYGFINTPEAAASDFAGQLAGALKVAASDVKVQVEWNPRRVTAYRQVGYAKHQLKKEQFRDNTVDAAEIGAAEAGNALYVVQINPAGEGPLGTMRVRFKIPGTADSREHEWPLAYDGAAKTLEKSSGALRLAASASAFSEWLVSSPFAAEVTPDRLLGYLSGVPEQSPADSRPKKLEWMIRQAKSLAGK